ncbi:pentapeptide repeat-containing protein [Aeromonas hydrophila]|uniref:pentapeptide repeat-containing protein n=1 Tax=Aeromonas hydrophila TaxID=644 RepID=UPI001A27532E|nr:pentapeptide repeat-containing protein [Aeromonas hydrophila]MCP3242604.1 pentapeptide repeat-containing protein [Aeromonas hydrophila]HAU4899587.1 hypothetical protein [Aeromonas hydrophila]
MNQQANTSLIFRVDVEEHRHNNFWESVHDEKVSLTNFLGIKVKDVSLIMKNGNHLKNYVIDISFSENRDRVYIKNATFDECDIQGNNGGMKITFKECTFKKVYFGDSKINDVNFESCGFYNCSFSLTRFYRCSFDHHCTFHNISISGGRTIFKDCIITPSKLLKHTYQYATENYCHQHHLNLQHQIYRMNLSIAKLARTLLTSVSSAGDDDDYYDAIKHLFKSRVAERKSKKLFLAEQFRTQALESENRIKRLIKKAKSYYHLYTSPLYHLESFFMNTFGFINGWGGSFIRCIIFGLLILIIYALIYLQKLPSGLENSFLHAIAKSIDITFVAGYTKHSISSDDLGLQIVHISNMLLGLAWYAVSIPTVVNKICLARV